MFSFDMLSLSLNFLLTEYLGIGLKIRDHVLHLTDEARIDLSNQYADIRSLMVFESNSTNMNTQTLDCMAESLSQRSLIQVLYANITAGENLMRSLPLSRQVALIEMFDTPGEFSDEIDDTIEDASDKQAVTTMEECFADYLELDKEDFIKPNTYPHIITNSFNNKVTISNLPLTCMSGVREYQELGGSEKRGTVWNASFIDPTILELNKVPAGLFQQFQKVQLTLAVLPGIQAI
jgi:hypothetical protein